MFHRVAVLLLAVSVASSSAASCICSASACPMAEAQAAAAAAQNDHADDTAHVVHAKSQHGTGSSDCAKRASDPMAVPAPMAPMDCCAGSGPSGIASAVDCHGARPERAERLGELSSSFQLRALGIAVQVVSPELTPPSAPSVDAASVAPAAAPRETLIAQRTSLLR